MPLGQIPGYQIVLQGIISKMIREGQDYHKTKAKSK